MEERKGCFGKSMGKWSTPQGEWIELNAYSKIDWLVIRKGVKKLIVPDMSVTGEGESNPWVRN